MFLSITVGRRKNEIVLLSRAQLLNFEKSQRLPNLRPIFNDIGYTTSTNLVLVLILADGYLSLLPINLSENKLYHLILIVLKLQNHMLSTKNCY